MAAKKKQEVDENTPVLGTGAAGDVENPSAGSPIDQSVGEPVEREDDEKADKEKGNK